MKLLLIFVKIIMCCLTVDQQRPYYVYLVCTCTKTMLIVKENKLNTHGTVTFIFTSPKIKRFCFLFLFFPEQTT
jgi:hypothetical protein